MSEFDPRKLVFVDECGTNIGLTPLRARAPKGKRAFGKAPRNRGKNTTLLASLSAEEGMGPAMAVEGATTTAVFEAYVEHFLAPALKEGQIVVLDNLNAHKGERVRRLVEARGACLLFLPSYSPDFSRPSRKPSASSRRSCGGPEHARRRRSSRRSGEHSIR